MNQNGDDFLRSCSVEGCPVVWAAAKLFLSDVKQEDAAHFLQFI